jgi:predicted DNA-binding protein (MmcQ/YjbR family)
MNLDWLRERCLSFPYVTEQIQWGDHLLFKVGGKMFAVAALEPGGNWLSLKASPDNFAELTERPGIIPAPYLARAQWVALQTSDALASAELAALLRESYERVFDRLPGKVRDSLSRAQRDKAKRTMRKKSSTR